MKPAEIPGLPPGLDDARGGAGRAAGPRSGRPFPTIPRRGRAVLRALAVRDTSFKTTTTYPSPPSDGSTEGGTDTSKSPSWSVKMVSIVNTAPLPPCVISIRRSVP